MVSAFSGTVQHLAFPGCVALRMGGMCMNQICVLTSLTFLCFRSPLIEKAAALGVGPGRVRSGQSARCLDGRSCWLLRPLIRVRANAVCVDAKTSTTPGGGSVQTRYVQLPSIRGGSPSGSTIP